MASMPQVSTRPAWLAAFLETQRIPAGSRLSSWFHGESEMGGIRRNPDGPGGIQPRDPIARLQPATRRQQHSALLQSPINFSRPRTHDGSNDLDQRYVHPAFASPTSPEPPDYKRVKAQPQKRKMMPKQCVRQRSMFRSKDPHVQCKSIGTLVSGVVLIVVLTTCKSVSL